MNESNRIHNLPNWTKVLWGYIVSMISVRYCDYWGYPIF